jgi:hypothetical protein
MRISRLQAICSLLLLSCAASPAQTALSTIRGTAIDPTGALVVNAEVTLTNLATNLRRTAATNEAGDFEIPDIPRGTYRLVAAREGFKNYVADNIILESSQVRRINISFELGAVGTEVTVRADAAVISTDSVKLQSGVTNRQYEQTPWVGGDATFYASLMLSTLPNVQTAGSRWTVQFAGQPAAQVQQGMDGHTSDGIVNQIGNMQDQQEVSAVMGNNSAEFSRVGYYNMVSKSGSNEFHGRASYWHNNSALAARDFFQAQKPKALIHSLAGSASGPIRKDKTFFYASWNGQRIPSKSFYLRDVPTNKMRQGDFSQLSTIIRDPRTGQPFSGNIIPPDRINGVSQNVLAKYLPAPNQGGPDALNRNYSFVFPYPGDIWRNDFIMQRIDHKVSEKNTVFARVATNWTFFVLASNYPEFSWTRVRYNNHIVIEDTHVFSPTLVNSFRFGVYLERYDDGGTVDGFTPFRGDQAVKELGILGVNPKNLSAQGFPTMNITGFNPLRTPPGGPVHNDRNWGYADSLTLIKGRHVLKFGGEYKPFWRKDGAVPEGTYGNFTFNGSISGNAFADFLLGLPYSSQRLDPLTNRVRTDSELGLYFQDAFKVNSRLNLEFGLRWERFGSPSYKDGLQLNWDPDSGNVIVPEAALKSVSPLYPKSITVVAGDAQANSSLRNFAPRVGFAYRPFGPNTVVRAAYGIFTETLGRYARVQGVGPFQISETYLNTVENGQPLFAFPNPFPAGSVAATIPSQNIVGFPDETENGRIHQLNLTIEHQIRDIGLRLSYLGSRSRGLNYNIAVNKPAPSLIPFSASRRPYPQFVGATFPRSDGAANYNAMTFEVQRKLGQLTFDAHWTWASSYSNRGNLESPYAPLTWGREAFTSRHRVVANAIWQLPFGRGRRFLAGAPAVVNHVVGGWQLYWIAYMETGQFFSPSFSGSDPSNTSTVGGLPDRIANGNLPADQRSIDRWFDASAFVRPPAGRFGNSGVNILEGPGLHQHHLSIGKRFHLTERLSTQFLAAISNLFNHPNFTNPNNNISIPGSVGTISGVKDYAFHRAVELRLTVEF